MPLDAITDETLRNDPSLKDFGDVNALAKSYVEGRALLGASIRIPGPDAGDEARAEFRTKVMKHVPDALVIPTDPAERAKLEPVIFEKLGKPKDAKDYAAPAGAQIPDQVLEALRKEAAEEGLTKAQFEARAKRVAEALVKASQAEKDELAALRKDLGEAYDERVAAGKAIAEKLGVPKDVLDKMGPAQLRVWVKAAEAIGGEELQVGLQGTRGPTKLTRAEARAQADEIRRRIIDEGRGMDRLVKKDLLEKLEKLTGIAMSTAA